MDRIKDENIRDSRTGTKNKKLRQKKTAWTSQEVVEIIHERRKFKSDTVGAGCRKSVGGNIRQMRNYLEKQEDKVIL